METARISARATYALLNDRCFERTAACGKSVAIARAP